MSLQNRYSRQRDLVPADKIKDIKAIIVGVGAIGRQCALQLSAMGVTNLDIIDFDTVEEENLAAQGFMEEDLKKSKVKAVEDICTKINSSCKINSIPSKFSGAMDIGVNSVLFCCVDSISTRKEIFEKVEGSISLFLDARLAGEFGRIFIVHDEKSREFYKTQLFPQNEAFAGSCTAKMTIYSANIAAGLMVAQFTKWLRNLDLDSNVDINLLTNEMSAR